MSKLCYITAYLDINRNNWKSFNRSFDNYLQTFLPYIELFKNNNSTPLGPNLDYEMIVFIDEKYYSLLLSYISTSLPIKLIKINFDFMNNLPMWKTLEKERSIMNSDSFQKLIPHRLHFPEHSIPEYTLINHSKIDFISYVINNNLSLSPYFSWVDFGFFSKSSNIPSTFLDINKLNLNTINYTLINPLNNNDNNIYYTLNFAPEKIGGFFFFGSRSKILEFHSLYLSMLNFYQNINICDDDQALVLACYFTNPSLFTLHNLGAWHKALTYFQISN
jgi:hypothetical protein